jgi:hypothetical protein
MYTYIGCLSFVTEIVMRVTRDQRCAHLVTQGVQHGSVHGLGTDAIFSGRLQLSKAGFEACLIDCINLGELNSQTTIALISDAMYDATCREKLVPECVILSVTFAASLNGHLRLDQKPI